VGLEVQGEYGGEGGARLERTFLLPEGEWYCSECVLDNVPADGEEGIDPTSEGGESDGMGSLLGLGGLAGSPGGKMARVQAEYHNMRRERNRVLKQWQQERRVAQLVDKSRNTNHVQVSIKYF